MLLTNSGEVPTLIADPGAGQSMTQAARDALRKVDSVLSENSGPLKNTIGNFRFSRKGWRATPASSTASSPVSKR